MSFKYQVLDHPADLKIKIWGRTRKELFWNCMKAMFKEARYRSLNSKKTTERNIKVTASGWESLLVNFLSEVLYLSEVQKEAYDKGKFYIFSPRQIKGELKADKLKSIGTQIKGVTWHNLEIKKVEKGWVATILFDV